MANAGAKFIAEYLVLHFTAIIQKSSEGICPPWCVKGCGWVKEPSPLST